MDLAALILVIIAAIIGPSIVVAAIGGATVKALSRNPSCGPILLMGMLVVLIFNEAVVIISLLIFFQLYRKL